MTAVDILFAVVGALLALAALYLLVPAVAALFYRRRESEVTGDTHVVVLIPAHDEEGSIAQSVRAFEAQTYPAERFEVVVVADNCTDDTARLARAAGAEVLVRDEPDVRGKGQALRWAIERLLAREAPPDGSGRRRRRLDRRSAPPRRPRRPPRGRSRGGAGRVAPRRRRLSRAGAPGRRVPARQPHEALGPVRPRARSRAPGQRNALQPPGADGSPVERVLEHGGRRVRPGAAWRGREPGLRAGGDRVVAGRAARPGRRRRSSSAGRAASSTSPGR